MWGAQLATCRCLFFVEHQSRNATAMIRLWFYGPEHCGAQWLVFAWHWLFFVSRTGDFRTNKSSWIREVNILFTFRFRANYHTSYPSHRNSRYSRYIQKMSYNLSYVTRSFSPITFQNLQLIVRLTVALRDIMSQSGNTTGWMSTARPNKRLHSHPFMADLNCIQSNNFRFDVTNAFADTYTHRRAHKMPPRPKLT